MTKTQDNPQKLTAERLRELLSYDPETGVFTSLKSCRQSKAGSVVGCNSRGYVAINLDGRIYTAHRLAWLYVHGEFPAVGIDHINGDKTDNRIGNLRIATASQNQFNRGLNRNNTTGLKGVTLIKSNNKYQAAIWVNRKNIFLGTFSSPDMAYAAYCAAAIKYHGAFARTR